MSWTLHHFGSISRIEDGPVGWANEHMGGWVVIDSDTLVSASSLVSNKVVVWKMDKEAGFAVNWIVKSC